MAERVRQSLTGAFRGWGFTTYERRALQLFVALILIGSTVRYYQHRSLSRRFELWRSPADSMQTSRNDSATSPIAALIDINLADAATLELLPGIGPTKAQRIIEWRERNGQFRRVEDLLEVNGIGPTTLKRLRDKVVIGGMQQ